MSAATIQVGDKTLYLQPDKTYKAKSPDQLRIESNRANLKKGPVKARKASDRKAALGEAERPKKHEESAMQKQCVKWFKWQYKREVLFAVPNGANLAGNAKRQIIQRGILEAEGVLPGVSDLVLVADSGVYFLEAKSEDGIQRQNQKEFEAYVKAMGYKYFIFRSLDEFQGIVRKLIDK